MNANQNAIPPMDEETERRDFLNRLFSFMSERGTSISYIPIFDHRELDLYKLYKSVTARGGLAVVVESKLWRQITCELGVDQDRTDAGFRLRMHYLKYLYPFERRFFLNLDDSPATSSDDQIPSGAGSPSLSPDALPSVSVSPLVCATPAPSRHRLQQQAMRRKLQRLQRRGSPLTGPQQCPDSPSLDMLAETAVDLSKLDMVALTKYRQCYRVKVRGGSGGSPMSASEYRDELYAAVAEHWDSQEVDEVSAIVSFMSALRSKGSN
eukprot:m51a1_g11838 putative at-rich interactive domain-containing protein 3b-like (266) ;mRNA; r:454168-455287